MPIATHDFSHVFIELDLAVVGLAVLARLANRWGFSAIPLYLLAGLAFGNGGLAPLKLTENFFYWLCDPLLTRAWFKFFWSVFDADWACLRGLYNSSDWELLFGEAEGSVLLALLLSPFRLPQ